MRVRQAWISGAIVLSAVTLPALAADESKMMDEAKAAMTPGETVLTGDKIKTLHSSKEAKSYRVCVKAEKESAPMKVTADGTDTTVQPGNCENITGKKIVATAAQPLAGNQHIVATFHEEKTKLSQKE